MDKVFYEETLKIAKQAREKKAKGEELSGMEKMYVISRRQMFRQRRHTLKL